MELYLSHTFRNELVRQREALEQKIEASTLLPPGEEIRYYLVCVGEGYDEDNMYVLSVVA